jgi:hypothetical protein
MRLWVVERNCKGSRVWLPVYQSIRLSIAEDEMMRLRNRDLLTNPNRYRVIEYVDVHSAMQSYEPPMITYLFLASIYLLAGMCFGMGLQYAYQVF